MITLIAFITMFIDHMGLLLFPEYEIFRMIWRIAFPLFAWGIVRGFLYTSSRENYMKRIFFLAIISQIPFFFLPYDIFNVCFTLLFWLLWLIVIETPKIFIVWKIMILCILCAVSKYMHFDYDIYGILMIWGFYFTWQKKITILWFFLLNLWFYWVIWSSFTLVWHIQYLSVLSVVLLYFTPLQRYDFKIHRHIKYLFYPVHFSFLYIISLFFTQ